MSSAGFIMAGPPQWIVVTYEKSIWDFTERYYLRNTSLPMKVRPSFSRMAYPNMHAIQLVLPFKEDIPKCLTFEELVTFMRNHQLG